MKNKRLLVVGGATMSLVFGGFGLVLASGCTAVGTTASGDRLERIAQSPQWDGERFRNELPQKHRTASEAWTTFVERGWSEHAKPVEPLPVQTRVRTDFSVPPPSGLRVTWLGHSTTLVEIDGQRVLFDPVWSDRASPFAWLGPERFHEPPLPLSEVPQLDAVVISHDHYDHLDYRTVTGLAKTGVTFVVPLGIGAHLEYWDIPEQQIVELDWWESVRIGEMDLVATPARHTSGRALTFADKDATLWASWAVIGPEHRVFFSGDTGLHPQFRDIGQRLGPFDVTMLEVGAYNNLWSDVHMGPEQAIKANEMLGGGLLFPIHWGTFNLSLHSWTEPMERLVAAAQVTGTVVATPRPGEQIEPAATTAVVRWWPEVEWDTYEEHPVVSPHLGPNDVFDLRRSVGNTGAGIAMP